MGENGGSLPLPAYSEKYNPAGFRNSQTEPLEFELNALALQSRIDETDQSPGQGIWVESRRGTGRGWKNYSSLEKTLWISLAIVSLITIGLIVSVIVLGVQLGEDKTVPITKPTTTTGHPWITTTPTTTTIKTTTIAVTTTKPPGWDQCLEFECVLAAAKLKGAMNDSVKPCEDFYQYACGGWIQANPIPTASGKWDQVDVMEDLLLKQIREILTMEIPTNETSSYPHAFLMAQHFYDSCLNQADLTSPKTEISDLEKLANELVGDLATNLILLGEVLGNIRREVGGNYLFSLFVDLDEQNSTLNVIYLDQPEFGVPRQLLDPENDVGNDELFLHAYRNLTEHVWALVFPAQAPEAPGIAQTILDLEIKLAKISAMNEFRRNRSELYNPYMIDNLTALTPNINWTAFLTKTFLNLGVVIKPKVVQLGEIEFDGDEEYIVRDEEFFEQLNETILKVGPVVLANFLKWRILFDFGNEASPELRKLFYEFYRVTQELESPQPRWKSCAQQTNALFGMAVSFVYVEKHFSEENLNKANQIVEDVDTAFKEILNQLSWIDDQTKEWVLEKSNEMSSFVGFPDWVQNVTMVNQYYAGLNLETPPTHHFKNFVNVFKWHNLMELSEIVNPKDEEVWLLNPTQLKSLYSPNYNSINFPAAILQNPFFRMPLQALNYGAIGAVIGHEITQAFTDTGIQSDADGNLAKWLNETTEEIYLDKVECFANQYQQFKEEDLTLNGMTTLGSNIADNGGLRQAFKAYQNYLRKTGVEKLLPGLTEYTSEKLFFLSYAQSFCGVYTPSSVRQLLLTGEETPNKFRVLGALQNSAEFATTWGCPAPEPTKICEIW